MGDKMTPVIQYIWEERTQTVWPREGDWSSVSAQQIEQFAQGILEDCVRLSDYVQEEAEYSFTPARAHNFRLGAASVKKRIQSWFGIA